jgi:hypothetical protein
MHIPTELPLMQPCPHPHRRPLRRLPPRFLCAKYQSGS